MGQVFIGALKQGLGGIRLMCGREGGDSLFCPCPGPHTWDRTAPQITIQSLIQPTEKFRRILSWICDLFVISAFFVNKISKKFSNKICFQETVFEWFQNLAWKWENGWQTDVQRSLSRLRLLVDGINGSLVRRTVAGYCPEMRPLPKLSAPSAK